MLFDSIADVEWTHNLGYPREVGGLVVLLDTATFSATAQNIESGAVVSDTEAKSVRCLGLKLKLPGGKTVLMTVTHAYVRNPALPVVLMRVADWVIRAKNALYRFRNPHLDRDSRAYGVLGQSLSNNLTARIFCSLKRTQRYSSPESHTLSLRSHAHHYHRSGRLPTASTT